MFEKHLKKAGGHIGRNVVEITIKMKTIVRKRFTFIIADNKMKIIVRKNFNDKDHQASSQKFRQQTPEEGQRTYRPKRCGNNNKDEDNSPKNLIDKDHQASSQKFRQQTPEEGLRTYRLKRRGNNNKDEDNSPKNRNDKDQPASSQKFRQLRLHSLSD